MMWLEKKFLREFSFRFSGKDMNVLWVGLDRERVLEIRFWKNWEVEEFFFFFLALTNLRKESKCKLSLRRDWSTLFGLLLSIPLPESYTTGEFPYFTFPNPLPFY